MCQVYESSDPKLWATPDTGKALAKLVSAARELQAVEEYISASQKAFQEFQAMRSCELTQKLAAWLRTPFWAWISSYHSRHRCC